MHHKPDPITGDYAEGVRGSTSNRSEHRMSAAADPVLDPGVPAKPSWFPTRKWWGTTGVAVATLILIFVSEGSVDFTNGLEADEWAVLGILAQRLIAFLVRNKKTVTGTGVPAAREDKF
jgi:hypothetical protein